jgi:hypothetical protein
MKNSRRSVGEEERGWHNFLIFLLQLDGENEDVAESGGDGDAFGAASKMR